MPDALDIEHLDIEQPDLLTRYLRETRRVGPLETPRVTVLAGGVSNRTVLVERDTGEAWVLKQALGKLRTTVDWYCDPGRIGREAMGLRWLAELAPPGATPPLVFEDPAHHLLAMRAVPHPHENWKAVLMAGRVADDHVRQFADLLAAVHRNAWLRRAELAAAFDERRFFDQLRSSRTTSTPPPGCPRRPTSWPGWWPTPAAAGWPSSTATTARRTCS
jgi:hypothetical protein